MSPAEKENYIQVPPVLHQAEGRILSNNIAYLNIPSVITMDSISLVDFASNLHSLIGKLDISTPLGWIIDLRNNPGGNCWPMIAGVGPLLGEGIVAYLIDSNNKKYVLSYKNGASLGDDTIQVIVKDQPYRIKKDSPIAVLIGPKTASSAEILAISFIGKSNCKSFGEPSFGVSTSNENYDLKDGAILFLTTAIDADRNLKKYGDKIYPDFNIPFSDRSYSDNDDPVILAACKWINKNN